MLIYDIFYIYANLMKLMNIFHLFQFSLMHEYEIDM